MFSRLLGLDMVSILDDARKRYLVPYERLIITFWVLAFIAYGFIALNHTIAGDEWESFQTSTTHWGGEWSFAQGRWMVPFIWTVLDDNYLAPTFTLALFVLAETLSFLLAGRVIGLVDRFSVFALLAISALFPFWAEVVNFKLLHGPFSFGLPMSCLSGAAGWRAFLALRSDSRRQAVLWGVFAALFFSLAASIDQSLSQFGAIVFLGTALNRIAFRAGEPPSATEICQTFGVLISVTVLGIAFYAAEVVITQSIAEICGYAVPTLPPIYELKESLVSNWSELSIVLDRFRTFLLSFLFYANHLFPIFPKIMFLLVFGYVVYYFITHFPPSFNRWLLFVTCMSAILIAPWSIGLIRIPDSYRYIAVCSASLFYGVVFGIANDHYTTQAVKTALRIATISVIIVFMFQQNESSLVTYANNRRDFAITNRLLMIIEQSTGYSGIDREKPVYLLLYGTPSPSTDRPFSPAKRSGPLSKSVISCGIYDCQLHRVYSALHLLAGDNIQYEIPDPDDLDAATRESARLRIAKMPVWPAAGSVEFISSNTIAVKFSSDTSTRSTRWGTRVSP
jgi:hypothetical protein